MDLLLCSLSENEHGALCQDTTLASLPPDQPQHPSTTWIGEAFEVSGSGKQSFDISCTF